MLEIDNTKAIAIYDEYKNLGIKQGDFLLIELEPIIDFAVLTQKDLLIANNGSSYCIAKMYSNKNTDDYYLSSVHPNYQYIADEYKSIHKVKYLLREV